MFRTIVKDWEIKETPLVTTLPYDYSFEILSAAYRKNNTLLYRVEKRILYSSEPITSDRIIFQPQETVEYLECSYKELPIFAKHYVNTNNIYISNDPHDVEVDDEEIENEDNEEQELNRDDPSNDEWYAWLDDNTHKPREDWDDEYPSTSGSYSASSSRAPCGPPVSPSSSSSFTETGFGNTNKSDDFGNR